MTENEIETAAAIIADWNWQIAEGHNYRYKHAVNTLVRYYECAPMEADEFKLVLEYLRTQKGVTAIELNQKQIDLEGEWEAKDAWYQTVNGDKHDLADTERVRVYQILIGKSESETGDGPYVIEDGCQYKVEHTFYWDQAEIPALPESLSGEQYTLQSLTRDRETGRYSAVVEKRERVQQDLEEYATVETAFEAQFEEQHLGVKKTIVEVELPDGTIVEKEVYEAGEDAGVELGTITERRVEKNPDCTANVTNRKRVAKLVEQARKTVRKGLRTTVTQTTDRNEEVAVAEEEEPLKPGETRTSELNDFELFDNVVEKAEPNSEDAIKIQDSCEKSAEVHTDTVVEVMPITYDEDGKEIPIAAEISEVGPNEEKVVSVQKNEDGVTLDKRTVTRTHTPVSVATESGSTSTKLETVTGVNQVSAPVVPENEKDATGKVKPNTVVRISASPNGHGSLSTQVSIERYEPTDTGGIVSGSSAIKTETKVGINQTQIPEGGQGGVNVVKRVSATPNEHGSFSTQETVETYSEVSTGNVVSGMHGVKTETETGINQVEVPAVPDAAKSEDGKIKKNTVVRISATPNEHGSFSTQVSTETHEPRTATISWSGNGGTYEYTSFKNHTSVPTVTTPQHGTVSASVTQNEMGTYDGAIHKFTPDSTTVFADGSILKQSWNEELQEEMTLPGGRKRKRKVTIAIQEGYCALTSAYSMIKSAAPAYKGYTSYVRPYGANNGFYRVITGVTFGAWTR